MLSVEELTTLDFLRLTGESAEYTAYRGDKYILWRKIRELKKSLDEMQTVANAGGSDVQIELAFRDYLQRLASNQEYTINLVPCVVDGKRFNAIKRTITQPRTVGRSWYPHMAIYMQVYDAMQTHPMHGEFIAWSTYVLQK